MVTHRYVKLIQRIRPLSYYLNRIIGINGNRSGTNCNNKPHPLINEPHPLVNTYKFNKHSPKNFEVVDSFS